MYPHCPSAYTLTLSVHTYMYTCMYTYTLCVNTQYVQYQLLLNIVQLTLRGYITHNDINKSKGYKISSFKQG